MKIKNFIQKIFLVIKEKEKDCNACENKIIGLNNKIVFINQKTSEILDITKLPKGLNIYGKGDNNIIKIFYPIKVDKLNIFINDVNNSLIELHENSWFHDVHMQFNHGNNQQLIIEKNFSFVKGGIYLGENNKLFIGRNSQFSIDVNIWCSDMHSILDISDNSILNHAKEMTIGEHVWLGFGTTLLKNASIASGCILGAKSLLVKSIEEKNTLIVGAPAKIVKHNIEWNVESPYNLKLRKENKEK